ncbi:MAG: alpha/beta fold hydrolase [Shimia sp.]
MPILSVIAEHGRVGLRDGAPPAPALAEGLRGGGPVVVLVHGYKFSPHVQLHDPMRHIFSLAPIRSFKAVSWPRLLGFDGTRADEGLCLAFTWPARGRLRDVHTQAAEAGAALADLIDAVRDIAPGRPIHLVGHSMGARVILGALPRLPAHAVDRAILLSGAEFGSVAEAALERGAGRTVEVLNVTSRENDLYDCLFEWAVRAPRRGDRALGAGLPSPRRSWLDIQIDDPETLHALGHLGFAIHPAAGRICHWSTYIRPGVFDLYREALRAPGALPLDVLRRTLPAARACRWSRLADWRPFRPGLPIVEKRAS